jgi:hypothetical protein
MDKGIWALVFLNSLFSYEDTSEQVAPLLHGKVFGRSIGGIL